MKKMLKKFFDKNPPSVCIPMLIFFGVPAYFITPMVFSLIADGVDPVFLYFSTAVMALIGISVMCLFVPFLGALAIIIELLSWLIRVIFSAIRTRRRRAYRERASKSA